MSDEEKTDRVRTDWMGHFQVSHPFFSKSGMQIREKRVKIFAVGNLLKVTYWHCMMHLKILILRVLRADY